METSKKEKAGADGLTKKERRALKVQAKQSSEGSTPTPSNVKAAPKQEKKEITPSKPNVTTSEPKQLTEKELRKLEWEKKLAQQNKTEPENKEGLSKAELKAKRREQQELQRQAKATTKVIEKEPTIKANVEIVNKPEKRPPAKKDTTKNVKVAGKVQLVQHLYISDKFNPRKNKIIFNDIHPSFVKLGVQFANQTIIGSNARCLALLSALKQLVLDLKTPPKQEFCRYLESVLQKCTTHLQKSRPFAVSMSSALTNFKLFLTQLSTQSESKTDNEKQAMLVEHIETYRKNEINTAGIAISLKVQEKISDKDVILTYGCSSLIKEILLAAHKDGKQFQVIVVDGRPLLEGREMLRRLVRAGIQCSYVLLNAVSFIMGSVTKVLLGAHALLTNGYVMSRIGTAQVALVAQTYNRPVLVCCETYKFSERVQTDSIVFNELDDPVKLCNIDTIADTSPLQAFKDNNNPLGMSLLYDVTPPDLITAVVTELAILPCTSVPVVLRIHAN